MWHPISLCLVFIIINRSKKVGLKAVRLKSIKLAKVKKKNPPQKDYEALSLYHGNLTLISFFDTRQKLFFLEIHFNLPPPETFFFFYLHVHSTKNARTYAFFFLKFPCYSCQDSRQSTQLKLFFFQLELPSLFL